MTANAENPGLAADLLRQASGRLSSAASWLGDRDPASLLNEVKSFARRSPGTFIIGAAILGVVVGRLTRALAANVSDEKADSTAPTGLQGSYANAGLPTTSAELYATPPTVEETPVYAQSTAAVGSDVPRRDAGDVRSDSV